MSTQPTDDDFQIRAAFEDHCCRLFGWSKGRLARWQVDDESLPPAVRGAYMIGKVQQMWQSWCAGAKWGTPATGGEPNSAFPITGSIYKRNDEWVLELAGTINDCNFTCRHTQPGHLTPEDVAGLPTLYTSPQPVREPLSEIAAKFEAMHAKGDVWITTIAAAQLVRGITGGKP